MASITLTGTLLDPTGEVAVGDQIRFTHRTTTGETIQFARSVLIIPPNGLYNITLEFGLIFVEYLDIKDVNYKSLGVVTVNQDSTATDLPGLLNAIVPPTDAQLLLFQGILQDTEDARDIALLAAAQQTTLELIASTTTHPNSTVLTLSGHTLPGDGGGGKWQLNGTVGQTPSQSPTDLADYLLNDGNGNQWALVDGVVLAFNGVQYLPLPFGAVGNGSYAYNDSNFEIVKRDLPDASIGFIFDDGYISHRDEIVPLFESKGVKCGFAPHTLSFTLAGRMTKDDVIQLNKQGYEFINHSYSHPTMGNDKENQFVKAEIDTAWATWNEMGINVKTFLTPSSVLGTDHDSIVRERYSFAFTRASIVGQAMRDVDRYQMNRQNIEAITTQQGKDAIDDAFLNGGSVVFYAHDVVNGDAVYNRTSDLIDYAQEVGIDILLPTTSIKDGIKGFKDGGSNFLNGKTIYNRRDDWSATNGATVSVDGNLDMRIVSTAVGQSLIQQSFACNLEDLGDITFSTAFRTISGTFGSNNKIGLKISDAVTTDVIYQHEDTIGDLDINTRRYNIGGGTIAKKVIVLLFVRADFTSIGGEVLLRDPILRYGNNVSPLVKNEINKPFLVTFPSQTITASGYTETNVVALDAAADNGLFEVVSDKVQFTKATKVSISCAVVAFGTDALLNSEGGMLFLDFGLDKLRASISTGKHTGGGNIEATFNVDPETNIAVRLFNVAADFPVSDLHSEIVIREIRD